MSAQLTLADVLLGFTNTMPSTRLAPELTFTVVAVRPLDAVPPRFSPALRFTV